MPYCVVIIEDEPDIAKLLCELLVLHGFEPVWATSMTEIAGTLAGRRAEVFLIDVMLRGTSGIDVARELRARAGYSNTPMVAMSASRTMVHFAHESGLFQDAIEKPFDIDGLAEVIGRYVPART
jgi:DNA-binding response OmpR family regulator